MKKSQLPELHTVNIESLSHDGRGITTINGKTTFVSGAIVHETVICKLTRKHSRYNEAEVTEVLTAAPERTTPLCAHYSVCGGCSMQHINSDAQIQFKQKTLLEQLKHFGKVEPEIVLPPISGNPWHYRRKARLGVRYVRKKERVLVGFREKFSNFLADIHACPVLHESVGSRIAELSDLIASLSQYEHIPQIEVAISDHETALIFRHLTPLPEEDVKKLREFAEANSLHFYLQPNSPEKIHKIWPLDSADKLSYFINLPDKKLEMQFYPLDFIQVNSEINQLMLKQALYLLDPQSSDDILDLFCGLGNFTLPLAHYAKHVVGVEGSHEMVTRAQENAQHNSISNVEFHAANLMEPSPSVAWMQKKYDKILLDPPRTGAKELLPFIPKFSAKKIVYVSCNPSTLARDAGELVYNYGYKLKQVGVINMFPHTSHIEAIALFEK